MHAAQIIWTLTLALTISASFAGLAFPPHPELADSAGLSLSGYIACRAERLAGPAVRSCWGALALMLLLPLVMLRALGRETGN